MINVTHFIINYLSPLTAFIAGSFAYRRMSLFWRLLFWQVAVYLFITIPLAYIITLCQSSEHTKENNTLMYNLCIPVETLFLTIAAAVYLKDKVSQSLMLILFIFFIGVYAIFNHINKPGSFNNYSVVAEGLLSIISYGMILYQVFRRDGFSWRRSPEIWVCIGLMIYFSCNVPYFSAFNYLNEHHPKASEFLFRIITDVLANIRYFLLAFAFWQLRRQPASDTVITYG